MDRVSLPSVISSLFHLRPSSGLYGPAAGLLGLGVVLAFVFVLSRSNPSPTFAEQPNAVSYGLDYARGFGLVGDPAEITIAKMSHVEFTELIGDEVLDYHREHNMEVWVLSMRGKVSLRMPGWPPGEEYDHVFVVLDAQTGEPKAVGARNQALQLPGGEKVTLQDRARFPITAPDVSAPVPAGPTSTPAPLNE